MSEHRPTTPAGRSGAATEPVSRPPATPAGAGDDQSALQPGDRIGFYQIEERLGAGGMGVVYRAQDTQLGRTVALKLLSRQLGKDQDLLRRFRSEAQIQARLTGRHIVTLHTIVQASCGLALVMEYVDGRTLARQLARHGALAAGQALRVFDHALRGVAQAHRLGIVHCDLKPGNIFLTRDGEIKLMDFGLSHLIEGRRLATPQLVFGTLRYMAPEQLEGNGADFRSDLYALGVSLYEAITGQAPFARDDPRALLHAQLHETPPAPSSLAPGVPRPLEAIIEKAMARFPDQRFQGAEEMRSAIQSLRRELHLGGPAPFRPATPAPNPPTTATNSPTRSAPPFTYSGSQLRNRKTPRPITVPIRSGQRPRLKALLHYVVLLGLIAAATYVFFLAS